MKLLSSLIMLTLLTSCFGLFDSKRDTSKIQIDPSNYSDTEVTDVAATNTTEPAQEGGISANQISLVMIDQKTVQKYGSQIVPRSDIAKVISNLASVYEINVGFVGFMFGQARDVDEDQQLADALKNAGNFFLFAAAFEGEGTPSNLNDVWTMTDNDGSISETPKVGVPIDQIVKTAMGIGFVRVVNGNIPLVIAHKGKIAKGAPLALAEAYLGENAQYYKGYVSLGGKSIKLTTDGNMEKVPNKKGLFNVYSFVDILNGTVPQSELNGDVVILGVGDVESTTDNLIPEAIGELLMNIVNN